MGKWMIDVFCSLLIIAMVMGILFLFLQALEPDAAFYEQRVTTHQRECIEAQQDARLAEMTR